tara:strand:- start:283 stop:804 length:522 start_codon:yes stop_codon:yes gene_type:complete
MIEGDSIPSKSIGLDEIIVFPSLDFGSYRDKVKYYTIKKKTLKVYPYAILASERLEKLNKRLTLIKGRVNKKKYTRVVEKYIEKELSSQLKKLTRTEGQILIKLIYRETGKTVHQLVKELRNGFRAFSYSSLAKLFDISIKITYDPEKIKEDAIIEDVLKRAYGDKSIILDFN